MPKKQELNELLGEIIKAFEHTSPEKWKKTVDAVFERSRLDELQELFNQEFDANTRKFFDEYLDWKRFQGLRGLHSGSIHTRQYWEKLIRISEQLGAIESTGLPLGLEGYHIECVTLLMRELLFTLIRMPRSKAEEFNDAGFERHHPGGYEEALRFHDLAIKLEPAFSLAWINKGIALKNLEKLDEAIACYDHVIEHIDSRCKKSWYNKGVTLVLKKQLQQAITCFDRALEIDPNYDIAKQRRIECLSSTRNMGCVDDCPGYLRDPDITRKLALVAEMIERSNWRMAAQLLEKAIPEHSESPCINMLLGEFLVEAGDIDNAEHQLHRALDLKSDCGLAWMNLTRCHLAQGDSIGALNAAIRVTDLLPHNAMAWANRASALCLLERFSEAERVARQALRLDDHNDVALYYLGVCIWQQGHRNAEARSVFEHFVKLCPESEGNESAKQILDEL